MTRTPTPTARVTVTLLMLMTAGFAAGCHPQEASTAVMAKRIARKHGHFKPAPAGTLPHGTFNARASY